ncbi:hypothetical protein [Mastigocladopsis repens]|uniref:hypothetical protein n=1 Tax=Mastigocladopsis repens TaxID=221287 RepID=UPI00030A02B3|nr:hypothetical protein [Mastigocladopsis repens]
MPLNSPNQENTKSIKVTATSITASPTSVVFLKANQNRKGATIWNECPNTLYIDLADKVALNAFSTKLTSGSYYELPFGYVGAIAGMWEAAGDGFALVREFV